MNRRKGQPRNLAQRRKAKPQQLSLARTAGWGGRREGAGRKQIFRTRVAHRARAAVVRSRPMHITIRCAREVPALRKESVRRALHDVFGAVHGRTREAFRVVCYSMQRNHLHLIVEADSDAVFRSAVRALCIRIAIRLNRALGRKGRFFESSYHRQDLGTPTQVRHAMAYVLLNHRRHAAKRGQLPLPEGTDYYSSAFWFDGFVDHTAKGATASGETSPTCAPRTWLATIGWRRKGLISVEEVPGD